MKTKPNTEKCKWSDHTPIGKLVQINIGQNIKRHPITGRDTPMPIIQYLCTGCGEFWLCEVNNRDSSVISLENATRETPPGDSQQAGGILGPDKK